MIPQLEVLMCLILQEGVRGTLPPAHPDCPVSVCISLERDSLFMGTDHASMCQPWHVPAPLLSLGGVGEEGGV